MTSVAKRYGTGTARFSRPAPAGDPALRLSLIHI